MLTIILVLLASLIIGIVASLALGFVWIMFEIGWKLIMGKMVFDGILFVLAGLFGTISILYTSFKVGGWLGDQIDKHDNESIREQVNSIVSKFSKNKPIEL